VRRYNLRTRETDDLKDQRLALPVTMCTNPPRTPAQAVMPHTAGARRQDRLRQPLGERPLPGQPAARAGLTPFGRGRQRSGGL